jgi:hypothetical protein
MPDLSCTPHSVLAGQTEHDSVAGPNGDFNQQVHYHQQTPILESTSNDYPCCLPAEDDVIHRHVDVENRHLVRNLYSREARQRGTLSYQEVASDCSGSGLEGKGCHTRQHRLLEATCVADIVRDAFHHQVRALDDEGIEDTLISHQLCSHVHHPVMLRFDVLGSVSKLMQPWGVRNGHHRHTHTLTLKLTHTHAHTWLPFLLP